MSANNADPTDRESESPGTMPVPAAATAEGRQRMPEFLRHEIARLLGLAPAALPVDRPLTSCGVDSLTAIEIQALIEGSLGGTVSLGLLLSGATIGELAAEIGHSPEPAAPAAAWRGPGAAQGAAEHPLSFGESALWYLYKLAPESPAYNLAGVGASETAIDADAMGRALAALVERHPALRATYLDTPAGPRRRLAGGRLAQLVAEDVSALSAERLAARLCEEAYRPFDLASGPPLRLHLFERSAAEHLLLLAVHHIAADFWSIAVLARELAALYAQERAGRPARLPPASLFHHSRAAAERERLAGPRGEALWRYWGARLTRAPVLELPHDRARPAHRSFRGAACRTRLDADAAAALRRLATVHRATLYTTLLAAFHILLHKYSGQDEVAVGTPVAERSSASLAGAIGYLVNTVLVTGDLAGEPPFGAWLATLRETVIEALDHSDLPFALLAERLHPERDAARSPLCEAFFTLHRAVAGADPGLVAFALGEAGRPLDLDGLRLRSVAVEERRAPFELALAAGEVGGELVVVAQYATDLWDRASVERLLGHFRALLLGACASPGAPISALPMLAAAERQQLLRELGSAETFSGVDAGVHQLVERQAATWPDRCAVAAGGEQITYGELDARATRLARRLVHAGVGAEVVVGIYAHRSPDLVLALLAVLKAGGACLPLDPALPGERLRHLVAAGAAGVVLVQGGPPAWLPPEQARTVPLDGADLGSGGPAAADPRPKVSPAQAAYVTFTSGSTGRPKGVINTHHGLADLLVWTRQAYALAGDDRVLQGTALSFDFALWEVFAPLAAGACLVLGPAGGALDVESLPALLAGQAVTVVHFVPTLLRLFVAEPGLEELRCLRRVLCGGEALPADLARRLLARMPVALHHLYGPTEASINALHQRLRPGDEVALGRPMAGMRCVLLDRRWQPVPFGVPGELCLGGPGLARGYLGRPDLTAERFIPDPLATSPGERLYRTGDLARWQGRGALRYLGRIDHQLKIGGVRIEPAEVEAALASHAAVREAVVAALEQEGRGKRLVAWVVPGAATDALVGELRSHLQRTLPPAMVPSAFVLLDRLPLTTTGKVDRNALPPPGAPPAGAEQPAGPLPRNAVEATLAEIWSQVLCRRPVGVHDNFFQLGGDSILSLQVAARARAAGLDLTPAALLAHQTIATLAEHAGRCASPEVPPGPFLPELRGGTLARALADPLAVEDVYPLAPMQLGMLARSLVSDEYVTQLSWRLRGELSAARFAAAWRETVKRHPALRVACLWRGLEEPVQAVFRSCELPWSNFDLRGLPGPSRRQELARLAAEDRRRGLDLSRPPLMRFLLVRTAEKERRFVWTHHHLLLDGWSLALVLQEVMCRYRDREPRPWEAPPAHRDFVAWLGRQDLAAAEPYFRQQLRGFAGSYVLGQPPADLERGGATLTWRAEARLSRRDTADLRALARARGLPMSTLVYGAWALLVGGACGLQDVAFGIVASGRSSPLPGIESMVGLLINTLPLRVRLDPDLPLASWWSDLLRQQSELTRREHTPLAAVTRWSGLPPGRPLFDSIVAFENYPTGTGAPVGAEVELDDLEIGEGTNLPLALAALPGTRLTLALSFDRRRLPPAGASRLLRRLCSLLRGFTRRPQARLRELSWSTPADERRRTAPVMGGDASCRVPPSRLPGSVEASALAAGVAALEDRLRALWADALGLPDVGRDGDFFALGGDSILALQIASRANRDRLHLTPRMIFAHPTVAALARAIDGLRPAAAGEDAAAAEGSGADVPLTPIQRRFFELPLARPHHWNQALVLTLPEDLDPDLLRRACRSLLDRHDALRLRFVREPGGWRQRVAAATGDAPVACIEMGALPPARRRPALAAVAAALQASLDLGHGPLLRLACCRRVEAAGSTLLWVIHHLAVDTISWRVLVEDLESAYRQAARGEAIRLRAPGISFGRWAEWLSREGPARVAAARGFWLSAAEHPAPRLPLDRSVSGNTEGSARTLLVRLTAGETRQLLRDLPRRQQRLRPQEALLAALLTAFRRWTGALLLSLDLEAHGREELGEAIDLSRTVGWFTSVFPLTLALDAEPGDEQGLDHRTAHAVARQLQAVPDRGSSYGLLRYCTDEAMRTALAARQQPEVGFNFLGQIDAARGGGSWLDAGVAVPGASRDPGAERQHLVDLDAWVAGGRLHARFTYSRNRHRRATIAGIAGDLLAGLRSLLAACGDEAAAVVSRQELRRAFDEVEL